MTSAGQLVRPLPDVPRLSGETADAYRRQVDILRTIAEFRRHHPYPPSVREIMATLLLSSETAVHPYLLILQAKGIITWEHYQSRTIRIIYDRKETQRA